MLLIVIKEKNKGRRLCCRIYFELPHDKTSKMVCAHSEDSDQLGHSPSLIRVFDVRTMKALVLSFPMSASEDSDQTGRMPRQIWVFAGRNVILLVLTWGGLICKSQKGLHQQYRCPFRRFVILYGPGRAKTYAICEQQRCRSACASAQSDQGLCCSLLG